VLFGASKAKQVAKVNEVKDYNMLPEPVIGTHMVSKTDLIIVYSSGVIECLSGKLVHRQKTNPAFKVVASHFTEKEHGHLLILQGLDHEALGVLRSCEGKWKRQFTTEGPFKYKLIACFGSMYIGTNNHSYSLIEFGGKRGVEIVTECDLKLKAKASVSSLGFIFDPKFLLTYSKKKDGLSNKPGTKFKLASVQTHHNLVHLSHLFSQQICDGFVVRINKTNSVLEIHQI